MKGKNRAKTALDWAVNEMPVQKNGELTCCETDYFSGVVACTSTFQGSVAVEGFFGRAHGGLYLFVALAKTLLLPFLKKKLPSRKRHPTCRHLFFPNPGLSQNTFIL
jgi:hypothetical protein